MFRRSIFILSLIVFVARPARADDMREFLMSCTYGVLAGTLVGTAMLAFVDKPGDNLNKIARGASIGLYFGIILGAYLVYGVSSDPEGSIEATPDGLLPPEGSPPPDAKRFAPENRLQVGLVPIFNPQQKLDGALAQVQVLRF